MIILRSWIMKKKVNDFFTKNLTAIITILLTFSGIASGYKILEYRVSELEKNKDSKVDYAKIEQMVNKASDSKIVTAKVGFETDIRYQKEGLSDVKRSFDFFKNKQVDFNAKIDGDIRVIRQALRDKKIITNDTVTGRK